MAEFLFMIQSVNLPPSAHPVHTAANLQCTLQQIFSAHCSKSSVHLQCTHTAAVITSSVHTAANLQCTLQQIFSDTLQQIFSAPPVHTHCSSHYILSAHCSYIIWCQYYTVHITSSAPLDHQKYVTANMLLVVSDSLSSP